MTDLVDAVEALNPRPRGPRWASLSSCVVDAVWSISVNYDAVTVPITRAVFAASTRHDADPLVAGNDVTTPDPVRLDMFLSLFPTVDALVAVSDHHRTSPRGGILKADAALRYAKVFANAGVQTRHHALEALRDDVQYAALNEQLRAVPGDGANGVRRGYLWMLIGDDDGIKPDRMVLRWLAAHGQPATASEASTILRSIATELTHRSGSLVTPWMVDHAVWLAARNLPPATGRGASRPAQ